MVRCPRKYKWMYLKPGVGKTSFLEGMEMHRKHEELLKRLRGYTPKFKKGDRVYCMRHTRLHKFVNWIFGTPKYDCETCLGLTMECNKRSLRCEEYHKRRKGD